MRGFCVSERGGMEEYNCYVDNELKGMDIGREQAEVDRKEYEEGYVMEQEMQGCAEAVQRLRQHLSRRSPLHVCQGYPQFVIVYVAKMQAHAVNVEFRITSACCCIYIRKFPTCRSMLYI